MNKGTLGFVTHKLMGGREHIFVRFPHTMPVTDMLTHLFWAKGWEVKEFYDFVVILCRVKPDYLKHFIKENKEYIAKFKHTRCQYDEKDRPKEWGSFEVYEDETLSNLYNE